MPDPVMGEKVCAFVIPDAAARPDTRRACARTCVEQGLARFKLPERLEVRDDAAAHGERQGAEGAAARRVAKRVAAVDDFRAWVRAELAAAAGTAARRRRTTSVLGAGTDDLEAGRAYLARARGHRAGGAVVADGVRRARRDARAGRRRARASSRRFAVPDLYPYLVGLELVGPTLLAHGTRRAVRALAAEDRDRRGDLVPAVLRAGRGLRPRRTLRRARRATATSGA